MELIFPNFKFSRGIKTRKVSVFYSIELFKSYTPEAVASGHTRKEAGRK
jgi:hypothetical protein